MKGEDKTKPNGANKCEWMEVIMHMAWISSAIKCMRLDGGTPGRSEATIEKLISPHSHLISNDKIYYVARAIKVHSQAEQH